MNVFASVMRTVVPVLVGWLLTATQTLHIEVDSVAAATGVTAAVTVAYYLVFRFLEAFAEKIDSPTLKAFAGIFLGWAKPPKYDTTKDLDALIQAVRESE